jgi:hypothetical protein
LRGETEEAYYELFEHIFNAFGSADFIAEIWARDAVDVISNRNRLRRILSAFITAKVRDLADHTASSLVKADPELMSGTEEQKQEMSRLMNPNYGPSWEARQARFPRAAERYKKLWEGTRSTLNLTELQAVIMVREIETIERIENLIAIEERRFDSIIREFDRHRMMQKMHDDLPTIEKAKIKTIDAKMIGDNKRIA